MSETKHSPLPWVSDGKVIQWLNGQAPGVAVRYEHEPNVWSPVCMVQPHLSGKYGAAGSMTPVEDAAFIVRAANCHDELVAACQSQLRLIDFIQRLLACYRTGSRPSEKILDEVGKAGDVEMQATAAIAKAAPGEP